MNYSEIQKAKERALGKIGATSNTNISNKFNTETIKKAKETALNKIQSKDNKTENRVNKTYSILRMTKAPSKKETSDSSIIDMNINASTGDDFSQQDKLAALENIQKNRNKGGFYNNIVEPTNNLISNAVIGGATAIAKPALKLGGYVNNILRKAQVKDTYSSDEIQSYVDTMTNMTKSLVDRKNTLSEVGKTAGNALAYIGSGAALGGGALGYAAASGANAFGSTNDIGDIAVETGIGAIYGTISSATNKAIVKGIEKLFPVTNPLMGETINVGASALKNAVAGAGGTYTATAATGESRNIYNTLRGREVKKEDWIRPVWSGETAISTLVGAGLGAYSGTKSDINARAKYEQDVNALVNKLNVYAKSFNNSIQKGDKQTALDIARTSRDELVKFSMNKYGNRTVEKTVIDDVANKWKDYLEQTTAYYDFVYNDMNANINGQPKIGSSNIQTGEALDNITNNATKPVGTVIKELNTSQNDLKNIDFSNKNQYLNQNKTQTSQKEIQGASDLKNIVKPSSSIIGLEDYSEKEIKDIVSDYIQDLDSDIKINGIKINSNSNNTDGLDVIVEYNGDISEDTIFNVLNQDKLSIDGVKVNITPVITDKIQPTNEYTKNSNDNENMETEVFEPKEEYDTSYLPKTEEEVKTNVKNRLTKEIEEDIKVFVENNTDDYQTIEGNDFDYETENIIKKMYTEEEREYLSNEDLMPEIFNEITDLISNELEKHFYTYNSKAEVYEPDVEKLENSDEIRFKYDKLPSSDFEYKQLDNIRSMIDDLTWDMKKTLPDGIDITVDESRASADATYITISNENTDETYEIRVGNHFKSGTSGNADEHIRISDFKTISKLKENIKETIENALIDVGSENIQNDTVDELKGKYDVDIMKESNYNTNTGNVELYDDGRATRVGELVNEFKDKLTSKQWNAYFKRIDNNGKKYNFGNNEKSVIHIGNKLIFSNYINGKPQVYDIVKLEARLLKTYGMTAKQFTNTFINKLVKEGYNETEIREFIRNLGEETLLKRNDTPSNVITNRSKETSENDGHIDRISGNSSKRNGFLQEDGKFNNNDDVKNSEQGSFSLSKDNQGRTLSKEQQEYFKDSKVRDENGNLLEVYHGTQNGGFTEFHGYSYFTDSLDTARSYSGSIENITKYTFESGQRTTIGNYKGYLNLINPYIIDLKGAEWGEINIDSLNIPEIQQWINEVGASTWNDNGKTFISTDDIISIVDAMNDSGKNYDGIILKNIRDNGMRANTNDNISTDYVAFKGKEQFKSIDNTKPTSNPDILKEPRTEYDGQTEIETPVEVLESTEKIQKPRVVGQRIWEGFKKQGYIDLNGKTVRDAQDVAELAQIFRNPKYETARVIYTKGDTIVGQEAVSSHLPNSSRMFTDKNTYKAFYKMSDRMKRLNADGYYMIHNHPSGTAKASLEDIKLTKKVANKINGFKGHIIVDHGTYAYIYKNNIENDIDWENELKVDDKNALYKDSHFETNIPNNKVPWNNIKLNSRDELAALMHNLKNSKNYSSMILSSTDGKINAIIDVPNNFFNMRTKHIEAYIRNTAKQYGASRAFIGTSNNETFNKIKSLSNLQDAVLYTLKKDEYIDREKASQIFSNEKMAVAVRTAEESKEERIERVKKYIEETQKSIGTLETKVSRKDIIDRIINNYGITAKGNSKELQEVSKSIQKLIEQGKLTDSKIEEYTDQLMNNLKVTIDDYYSANKELKELIRGTKLYVSDEIKNGFGSWNDFRKSNVGSLRLTNDSSALPVDTFYQELSEMYGEVFFPSDIGNASDQLEKLSEVVNQIKKIDTTLKENIRDNFGEEAIKEIKDGLAENLKTLRENLSNKSYVQDLTKAPDEKYRSWSKTARSNEMLNEFLNIKDLTYVVKGNKATVDNANNYIISKGYNDALKHFESVIESGKLPSADDIAIGERLIQEALKQGDFEKATQLVSDVTILGTELGQSVQAMSIISRLSPEGQLMHLRRAVERINSNLEKKKKVKTKKVDVENKRKIDNSNLADMVTNVADGEQEKMNLGATDEALEGVSKFKKNNIEITPEMELTILSATTPEELKNAMDRVKEQLAEQMPVTISEKLVEWRYLMMLGNPKTHIRNIIGNLAMIPLYEEKNLVQRVLETIFDSKLEERTKTFKKSTEAVKKFADAMVEESKDMLTGNGYSNIQSEIKSMRKIYKAKILQILSEYNSKALDFEDFVFKKKTFKSVLAEYLTANGIKTEIDIKENPELIQRGINFAVEEAKKATFNQYNAMATAISKFENSSDFGKIAVGGIAPFKRTPLNIAKTSWQYSPAGLTETLIKQTKNLKNGFITSNEYIERISQGLTGLSITLIGILLASMGILTASRGNGKKDKYEEEIGINVPYSIKVGDKFSIDISWLAPSAVSLLIGAEIYSTIIQNKEKNIFNTVDDFIKILEKTMNPISNMTMLSTFNNALINYGGDDDVSGLAGVIDTVIKSYIGQAFPTLGNQINKIIDPTVRSTMASKNSKFKFGEQIVRQNMNKVTGASYLLEPSIDMWGNVNKRSDSVIARSADALFNPANITSNSSTKVDNEIIRLYNINMNTDIIPSRPKNTFTTNSVNYELSASEYTQFKITYGQTAYESLEKLFKTSAYKQMSDADKEKAIKNVYDISKEMARYEYLTNKYGEKDGINRLLDSTNLKKYNSAKEQVGLNYKDYVKVYYAQKGVEGNKNKQGETINGSKKENQIKAIMNAMPKLTKQKATVLQKIFAGI